VTDRAANSLFCIERNGQLSNRMPTGSHSMASVTAIEFVGVSNFRQAVMSHRDICTQETLSGL
jgi:hypothetical protein